MKTSYFSQDVIEFFYERSEENIKRLYQVLSDFWGGTVPEIADASE